MSDFSLRNQINEIFYFILFLVTVKLDDIFFSLLQTNFVTRAMKAVVVLTPKTTFVPMSKLT